MTAWIVLRYEPEAANELLWREIQPRGHGNKATWEGEDAQAAFAAAVLNNEDERGRAASYRILRYSGGASFSVRPNIDVVEHDVESEDHA